MVILLVLRVAIDAGSEARIALFRVRGCIDKIVVRETQGGGLEVTMLAI